MFRLIWIASVYTRYFLRRYMPTNILLDAIRTYDEDAELKAAMGEEFSAAYTTLKTREWNSYCSHLTQWERDHTLDI